MESERFWDRNPKKFRLLILFFTVLLVSVVIYNMVNYASTVFSGTVYMNLPSKMYIKQNLYLKSANNSVDTVPAGSFLLTLNGKLISTSSDYNDLLKNIDKDSIVTLNIFNVKTSKNFLDTTQSMYFKILSDTFYVKNSDIPNDYIKFLTTGSFLGYIVEGGATERAGIKAGDVLLTIKDTEVKMVEKEGSSGFDMDFFKFFRNQPKGEPIPYTVLRSGELLTFNVWIATFGISTLVFLVVLCGLCYIALGLYYGFKRPNLIPARLISLAFLMIGFEISLSLNLNYPEYNIYSFVKIYLTNIALIFFLPVLFYSLIYFPDIKIKLLSNKWHLRAFYLIAILTAAVFSFWYFTDMKKTDNGVVMFMIIGNMIYYMVVRLIYSKHLLQ
ncbi:MAG: PDZ domain-containing protein [Ignavibacteriae bacterium]|nr:PDZ domain-containing protein [Ignavibacteriota bacterium]